MIRFLAEFPDILSDNSVPYIETPISIAAARSANAVGSATIVVPDFLDRRSLGWNTRMRLWRTGQDGTRSLFGNTEWFLRSIIHNYSDRIYSIEFDDALALLDQRLVAYTSDTPYADKTLEELGLILPNNTLRIDNMMRAYVRENYGALVLDAARENPYISVEEDGNLAPYGEMTAAWKVLGEVLSELAKQSAEKGLELFYDLIPQPNDTLLFVVRSKVFNIDRGSDSKRILTLSEDLNQLTEVVETEDFREVGSYAYVLGYDSGPSQVIIDVPNSAVIASNRFGRVEFTESIPEDYKESVLISMGQAALQGRRPRRNVSARVVEGGGIVYGRDYSYGDRLMIHVGTRKYNCHVHAVSTRWEAGQEDLEVRLNGYDEDAYPSFLVPGPTMDNAAPVANAGPDQEISSEETADLAGSATDDGNPDPPGALTYLWTKVFGSGTVTFGDATDPTTTADFSEDGTYVLRLRVSDSALVDTDDVTISVGLIPIPPPDSGLIEGQELVAGIGLTELYRTSDFQTVSGGGGPTWTAHTLTTEDILSWVVDPFSPGYLTGAGTVDGWVVTDTDIYRVTDIFGTVGCTSIHTFAVPLAGSTEWRTIQASFGTYFAEGLNPWLMVVSHYADAAGHEGTWALRSLDGGATWEAEAQISEFYDSGTSTDTRPIAVYLSPKTPGLAYAVAFIITDDLPQSSGFVSTDWGETWTQMVGDFIENPANPLPAWGRWPDGGSLVVLDARASASIDMSVLSTTSNGTQDEVTYLLVAPPANAKRIEVHVEWGATRIRTGAGTSNIFFTLGQPGTLSRVDDIDFSVPAVNTSNNGSFDIEWTFPGFAGGDWPVNRTSIVSSPPVSQTAAAHLRMRLSATTVTGTEFAAATYTATITEIELDDGTIYAPPVAGTVDPNHRLAGDMHVPWEDNDSEALIYHGHANVNVVRQFRLKRVNVDGTITDISPQDSGINYGVNHYGFAIRAYDSDRTFMLAAVTGNGTSRSTSGDKQGVYISDDAGATWVEVVAPATGTEPYRAAFAGDTEQVLFLWGPSEYMGYSSDFGVAIDSRAGNLAALSATRLVGIAGGPTP